jgi:tRNA uridine 5-carboxymethylaminomethyl modification enzyme
LGNRDIDFLKLCKVWPEIQEVSQPVLEFVKTNSLYESYITRQDADIRAYRKDETLMLPSNLNFQAIGGLSSEAKQALISTKPRTLGHASRVPGVTPAAVMILMRYVKSGKIKGKKLPIIAAE